MHQATMSVNIDYNDMVSFENFCQSEGTNASTVVSNFIKDVLRERKLSFDEEKDPFYNDYNMAVLHRSIEAAEVGKVTQHDLIEV